MISNTTAECPPCEVLREAVSRKSVLLPTGEEKRLGANISMAHADALYKTVLRERPELVIEIGMAQGISTLTILCALQKTGGRLISIDPYVDWPSGKAAALHNVERAGYSALHQHIQAKSYEALPRLLAEGVAPRMGYIDGAHDFGNCFIDCFYLDAMLPVGGLMGFNDAGWLDVHRVIRLLQKQGRYSEINVGLRPDYAGRNLAISIARRILRIQCQDRYFRKVQRAAE